MKLNVFQALSVVVALPALLAGPALSADVVKPLRIIQLADWADMSDREQEIYVSGVLEGKSFMIYGRNHPDHQTFVDCVNKAGVRKINAMVNSLILLGDDSMKSPMPWVVAKAIGQVLQAIVSRA